MLAQIGARELASMLRGARQTPEVTEDGLTWRLEADADAALAIRAVLAWFDVRRESPGRLRLCENERCGAFLLDHSNANTRRWCSMKTCGNRLKAQRHYDRKHRNAGDA